MDYFDFTRWLQTVVTEERYALITETFELLESLTDAQVYDIAINLGAQLERTDTVSILDSLNSDMLTITDNVLLQYGITIDPLLLTTANQNELTRLLSVINLIEGYECPVRILQIIEASDNYEDALLEIAEEVTGASELDLIDLVKEVSPSLIERIVVLYQQKAKTSDVAVVTEPTYSARVRVVAAGTESVVAEFIQSGGSLGLPLDSYLKLFLDNIEIKTARTLSIELFMMLLASGHLSSDNALKAITGRLDRFDISLKIKMELAAHLKRLYTQHGSTLNDE